MLVKPRTLELGSLLKSIYVSIVCGTLKCENASKCEKVAKCNKIAMLNVKIDAICEMTLNVKTNRLSKCIKHLTLNVLKSTL